MRDLLARSPPPPHTHTRSQLDADAVASLQSSCSHQTFLNTLLATMPPSQREKSPQSTPKKMSLKSSPTPTYTYYNWSCTATAIQDKSGFKIRYRYDMWMLTSSHPRCKRSKQFVLHCPGFSKLAPEVCISQNLLRKTCCVFTFTKKIEKDMTGLEPRCLINDRLHPRRAVHAITNEEEA